MRTMALTVSRRGISRLMSKVMVETTVQYSGYESIKIADTNLSNIIEMKAEGDCE